MAIAFVENALHLWVYYIKCCRLLLRLWFITFADIIKLAGIGGEHLAQDPCSQRAV